MANNVLTSNFSNRQYMLNSDFEIYYYSDTNMQHVKNHTHNYYEFYFFLGGDVSLSVNNTKVHLSSGDIILIPPNTKHHLTINNPEIPYQRFIFWISTAYCNKLMNESKDYGYVLQHSAINHKYIYHLDVLSYNSIQTKIMNLIEELHFNRFGRDAKIGLCVNDLMLALNRNIYEVENPAAEREEKDLYQNLVEYIEHHIAEDLSLNQLAEEFFVSKYHIAHVFKQKTGLSIHQYIQKRRLSLCKGAILSGTEITSAYLQFGFNDYSSFFRAFKKEYGLSPKEYKLL